jgi:hypothetical protein
MVDNLKSAVLQRLAGTAPVFNPRYLDFARHQGFTIVPCNVGRGNEKGRVESGVGYVKRNFLHGIELTDFTTIQAAAQVWLDSIANLRIHGETYALIYGCRPKPMLRPRVGGSDACALQQISRPTSEMGQKRERGPPRRPASHAAAAPQ